MKYLKKIYEKPETETVKVLITHHLLENSGETDEPMGKGNDLWDDELEEDSASDDTFGDLWD